MQWLCRPKKRTFCFKVETTFIAPGLLLKTRNCGRSLMERGGQKPAIFSEATRNPAWFRRLERGFVAEEWRHVALLNYEVEPELLAPFVPKGTELDSSGGQTWLSLVGLVFRTGHFFRLPVTLARSHVQIQLRFYVRRKAEESWRPGQVVLKELGNRNALFHPLRIQTKKYRKLQMMRTNKDPMTHLRYVWNVNEKWNSISLSAPHAQRIIVPDSREAFVTQRLWDYSVSANQGVHEIRIKHPSWRYHEAERVRVHLPSTNIFGERFESVLKQPPSFALIAEGSPVLLCRSQRI